MLHYLPGCDVKKNHSEAILKIENYMKDKDIFVDFCCRVKNKFLEDSDTIITNCTLCDLVLNETHPNNKCLSIYEFVLEDKNFPWVDHYGEQIIVQDCWRTRANFSLQKAIRQCLTKMNYSIIEMDENYSKTKFCGVWLNNKPTKDCIEVAPHTFHNIMENHTNLLSQEEQLKRMQKWVSKYPIKPILVYCNGCERGIKFGGGEPIHMIELLSEGLL